MMKCPACESAMTEKDFGGVKIDICENGCKGMWFDWFELQKLDEKHEGAGKALREALAYPRNNDQGRPQIKCPKCGVLMHIHKYASNKEVNVDECYACGGFFLDSGELREIRENFMTDEEADRYVTSLINDIPEYAQAVVDLDKKKARVDALRKYTKLVRLSYYMTGE
jgi:uncharacterized protein